MVAFGLILCLLSVMLAAAVMLPTHRAVVSSPSGVSVVRSPLRGCALRRSGVRPC